MLLALQHVSALLMLSNSRMNEMLNRKETNRMVMLLYIWNPRHLEMASNL